MCPNLCYLDLISFADLVMNKCTYYAKFIRMDYQKGQFSAGCINTNKFAIFDQNLLRELYCDRRLFDESHLLIVLDCLRWINTRTTKATRWIQARNQL